MSDDQQPDEVLARWVTALVAELGLDPDAAAGTPGLLDMTKVVAHTVVRPAAPVSALLCGLAAGRAGGSAADIQQALDRATELAERWS
ncbi:MAG: DUF6457 domain-containing protein [Propionibacteriaceae bacterium]|jgi:hypothetical protein|nr:DUF6457 domain-containing protein [Propionibacteriaceae bacterium]